MYGQWTRLVATTESYLSNRTALSPWLGIWIHCLMMYIHLTESCWKTIRFTRAQGWKVYYVIFTNSGSTMTEHRGTVERLGFLLALATWRTCCKCGQSEALRVCTASTTKHEANQLDGKQRHIGFNYFEYDMPKFGTPCLLNRSSLVTSKKPWGRSSPSSGYSRPWTRPNLGPLKVPLEAVSKISKNFGFLSGRFWQISIRKSDLALNLDNFYPDSGYGIY